MEVSEFLRKFVNKVENTTDFISLFLNRINCKFGAIFVKINNSEYKLINHLYNNNIYTNNISYTPYNNIDSIYISNNNKIKQEYICNYNIQNIIIIPIHVDNNKIGVICIGNKETDIIEQDIKKIEDLISLAQLIINKHKLLEDYKKIYSDSTYFSKDLFLANMSHEIRTPLNGIVGYNQLLSQTLLNDKQKGYVSAVSNCSLQLMKIINDIIDFSKLSSGNMKISQECFSVSEMVNIINDTMKQRIKSKKQTCEFKISRNVPQFIILDQQKLIQVIINLMSNATKFTPIGGDIEVLISNTKNILTIDVIDSGIGISEKDQCKLFNSFVQINNSLTKQGTGLGLAICKRLVTLLKGDINVKSHIGQGSTFTVTCSHIPSDDYEKYIKKDLEILKDKYILVVDDNPDNRILLGDILFEWDMNPVICASSKEALKILSMDRYNFELGLIDICMPDIDGIQLAREIKEMKPLFPLIALSSLSDFVSNSDFDIKLDKPINKLRLFNSIHKLVQYNRKDDTFIGEDCKHEKQNITKNKSILSPNKSSNYFEKDIKILIAEDILYNQTLLHNMVSSLGYKDITLVSDGEDAIEKVDSGMNNNTPYGILLLDLRMPKMDGYEVIQHIRKKGYPLPKIVAVTASVLEEDRNKCSQLGVQYFINKPIDINCLKNVLLKVSEKVSEIKI